MEECGDGGEGCGQGVGKAGEDGGKGGECVGDGEGEVVVDIHGDDEEVYAFTAGVQDLG